MKERDMSIASVQKELDTARYRLEALGGGGKLAARDKIARLERQLNALMTPQDDLAALAAAKLP